MQRFGRVPWPTAITLLAIAATAMTGCAGNSMVLQGQIDRAKQQQLALTNQNRQLQQRATALDEDNQELQTLLAQSRQQAKVVEDQLTAVRDQLRGVTEQVAAARKGQQSADNKVEALTASMRRRGGVAITPNNSMLAMLPAINLPDVHVSRDGDMIRVALPGHQLFKSGSARLRPEATNLIASAAAEIVRTYPDQIVSVEGHTDSDPITGTQWRNNHELSVGRAMAVFDLLVTRTRLQADQLYVVGQGSSSPVASNATPDGKRRNRRIELVIHPRKKG